MNNTVTTTVDAAQTAAQIANATPQGFSYLCITACFVFMIWQSYLQYKTKSKNDIEIENLKQRLAAYDNKIGKLFDEFERLLAIVNRIDGMLTSQTRVKI
jgi:TRAP-type C4-dicarboxylate transport system permease small subunit